MYQDKMAFAVKVNGRVVRDNDETAFIPFGAEYSLFIKNLNSVRALVRVSIDGKSVTDDVDLVVGPNQSIDLERYIQNGNLSAGQRFKFIERTAKIENGPRGIKVDDGLIRIEYEFERVKPPIKTYTSSILRGGGDIDYFKGGDFLNTSKGIGSDVVYDTALYSANATSTSVSSDSVYAMNATRSVRSRSASLNTAEREVKTSAVVNDVGITVGGSVSTQQFSEAAWFPTDGVKHVMIMKILGETETGKPVERPVLVRTKVDCPTCGTKNKVGTKFCRECGTGLIEL